MDRNIEASSGAILEATTYSEISAPIRIRGPGSIPPGPIGRNDSPTASMNGRSPETKFSGPGSATTPTTGLRRYDPEERWAGRKKFPGRCTHTVSSCKTQGKQRVRPCNHDFSFEIQQLPRYRGGCGALGFPAVRSKWLHRHPQLESIAGPRKPGSDRTQRTTREHVVGFA